VTPDLVVYVESLKKKRKKKSGTVLPYRQTESIEMIIEDHAFSPSPATQKQMEKERQLVDGRGGRSQIIRRRESLVLYKLFNTLCRQSMSPLSTHQVF
jgi:hypothetical protein